MTKRPEWEIFEKYVDNLVLFYLNTSESKDFLRGVRFSLTKFKEDLKNELNKNSK